MTMKVPYFVPDVSEEGISSVADTIRSGWLTSGPKMVEFEGRFGEAVRARHAIAVNSCTSALHLALHAIGVGPGDDVIVPAMTFAATASVVLHAGARPVLVDVDPDSLLIDPETVKQAMTPQTKAVIPVHYGGQAADVTTIREIAATQGSFVIEDAAHAFPSELEGASVGSLGDLTCFSFYATKTLTTGEGGMITLEDDALAERLGQLRLHGLNRDAWNRYNGSAAWDYDIAEPGYKYNMTDIAAAIGLEQLGRAGEMREARQRVADTYSDLFADVPGVVPLAVLPDRVHAWHLYVIRLGAEFDRADRNSVIEELRERGIGTSVHYRPLHMHSFYRDSLGYEPQDFPVAAAAFDQIISLPIYSTLTEGEIEYVVESVKSAIPHVRG